MASIIRRKFKTKITYLVSVKRKGIKRIHKTFNTRTEAKRWARSMEVKLDRGDYSDYSEAGKLTLGDIANRYIKGEYHKKKKGWRYEEYRYKQLLEDQISEVNLLRLSSKHLAEYRDRRLEKVESATWNKDFNFVSVVINAAIFDWGIYLPNNPCKLIKRLKEPPPRKRIVEDWEHVNLLDACTKSDHPYLKSAYIFSLETAMRQGEMLKARYQNINFQKLTLYIPDTKTGFLSKEESSERTIPLSNLAIQTVMNLPRDFGGKIFPVTRDSINKYWMKAKEKAGVKDLMWRDLRRTGITWMFEKKGLSVPEVQVISGHKNPLVLLNTYTQLNPTKIAQKI